MLWIVTALSKANFVWKMLSSHWRVTIGVMICLLLLYIGWWLRATIMEKSQESVLKQELENVRAQQQKLKEKNDALQIANSDINAYRLRELQRIKSANSAKLSAGGGKCPGLHVPSPEWLTELAAVCETYRQEVIVCSGQSDD